MVHFMHTKWINEIYTHTDPNICHQMRSSSSNWWNWLQKVCKTRHRVRVSLRTSETQQNFRAICCPSGELALRFTMTCALSTTMRMMTFLQRHRNGINSPYFVFVCLCYAIVVDVQCSMFMPDRRMKKLTERTKKIEYWIYCDLNFYHFPFRFATNGNGIHKWKSINLWWFIFSSVFLVFGFFFDRCCCYRPVLSAKPFQMHLKLHLFVFFFFFCFRLFLFWSESDQNRNGYVRRFTTEWVVYAYIWTVDFV